MGSITKNWTYARFEDHQHFPPEGVHLRRSPYLTKNVFFSGKTKNEVLPDEQLMHDTIEVALFG